jgi:hypothetical protein
MHNYVWQDIINETALPRNTGAGQCRVDPVISREYMTTAQTDGALQWWRRQTGPRMLTVAYNAIHTPLQQPPLSLAQSDSRLECQGVSMTAILKQRMIGNAMLQAMDLEIGRLLQGMGLATLDTKGVIRTEIDRNGDRRIPELEDSGTMVVIIGDNGTFGYLVKAPFDRPRSKGTVYQTGVGVPLIVAGSLVHSPTGRIDNHMISAADLFQLFGEIAGLDVNQIVPPAHVLDSKPMLVHLTNPHHGETRANNYTELGEAVFKVPTDNTTRSWPCVVGGTIDRTGAAATVSGGVCSDGLFSTRAFCEQENNGLWFGPPDNTDTRALQLPNPDPNSYRQAWNSCCAVRALSTNNTDPALQISLLPTHQYAERDTRYKYVQREFADCSKPLCPGPGCDQVFPPFQRRTETEFYDLQQTPANPAGLDKTNLACSAASNQDPINCVPEPLRAEFRFLQSALKTQLDSEARCTGDGNLDKRVNQFDIAGASALLGAGPSVFDFNDDGQTDAADVSIIRSKLGTDCIGMCQRADLNRDGSVDDKDLSILKSHFGPCELCGSDLNGDGVVNDLDVSLMKNAIKTCPNKKSKDDSHEPAEK